MARARNAWNAFRDRDTHLEEQWQEIGPSNFTRPDRPRLTRTNEKTIVNAILNRIAIDVASCDIKHVKLDENNRYLEEIDSNLNTCLQIEANIDQTGRALIQDIVLSMLDEGVVAVVPVDILTSPRVSSSMDILSLRTAKITRWYPEHVTVDLYNQALGIHQEVTLPKSNVAIVENPLYSILNERNSVLQRLLRKMSLMDVIDEQQGAGKLDLIFQLPYIVKSEARKEHAENRLKEIEKQLAGSQYGIAYTDGTEKITQLNRSVENNLLKQVEGLTETLYSQLGITAEIMNGTANDATMQNYYTRTIEPIISALTDEFYRKFLTKTARSQKQSIMFFRDPFKLVPVTQMADIADKFTRNEIMTSNELRQVVGLKPSMDPNADQLRNKNLNQSDEGIMNAVDVNGNPIHNQLRDPGMDQRQVKDLLNSIQKGAK